MAPLLARIRLEFQPGTRPSMATIMRTIGASFAACILLSGCAAVGPDFREPAPPATQRYTDTPLPEQTASVPRLAGGTAQHFVPGGDLPAQWWSLYRSPALDRLIRQALDDSPTLAAAQATLRQAQENLAAQRGSLTLPGVDLNVDATRERLGPATAGALGAGIYNLYNASVNVSYTLDLFGGNRRELEGLESVVDYQRYQLEAARLTLTSNIVTTAIREASLRAQMQATQEIIAAEQKQLELVRRQYELGAVARPALLTLSAQLDADARDASAARTRSRADAPPARGIERAAAQRRRAARVRARLAEAAAGTAGERPLPPGPAAAGHPRQRSAAARGERAGRRGHRGPVSADHAVGKRRRAGRAGAQALRRARGLEPGGRARAADLQRRRARGQAPRRDRRPTSRPRRSTARRCCSPSRTWPTRCARSNSTRRHWPRRRMRRPRRVNRSTSPSGNSSLGGVSAVALLVAQRSTSRRGSPSRRRRPRATPTPPRCSRRWAAAGGTRAAASHASTQPRHPKP